MNKKILQVFYGADALPYKDKERTVHFPIVGNAIQNANNTTQIKFYFDRLVEENEQTTFVAVSKLPNGKIGSKILETYDDKELGEQYALLDLDSFYTQYKGDVFISLQGYQGGVIVEQDTQGIYQIYGTPVIAATGSIKLAINYAPSFVGSGETENVTLQQVLGELSTKLGIRQETLHVEELPTVGNPDIWYVVNDDGDDPNKQNIYIWNATTQTYVWVGDNTLDLGDYYTTEQGEQFENDINEDIATFKEQVENEIESVASGSPKGIYSTLADLQSDYPTGTTGIYVVSADGHWYYWNGSAWTDGGVYLSTVNAVPDTRTIAGIDLEDDITDTELIEALTPALDNKFGLASATTHNLFDKDSAINGKLIDYQGRIVDYAQSILSGFVKVEEGKQYLIQEESGFLVGYIVFYNSLQEIICAGAVGGYTWGTITSITNKVNLTRNDDGVIVDILGDTNIAYINFFITNKVVAADGDANTYWGYHTVEDFNTIVSGIQIVEGTMAKPYVEYEKGLSGLAKFTEKLFENAYIKSNNLFDKSGGMNGKLINYNAYSENIFPDYSASILSGFVKIEEGKTYSIYNPNSAIGSICFFNNAKEPVCGVNRYGELYGGGSSYWASIDGKVNFLGNDKHRIIEVLDNSNIAFMNFYLAPLEGEEDYYGYHTEDEYNEIISMVQVNEGENILPFMDYSASINQLVIQNLNDIDKLKKQSAKEEIYKVTLIKEGNDVYFRSSFNSSNDILVIGNLFGSQNGAFNYSSYKTISKTDPKNTINGSIFKYAADDVAPILTMDSYRGGNHGDSNCYICTFDSSHGLAEENIGEIWTDGETKDFLIVQVPSSTTLIIARYDNTSNKFVSGYATSPLTRNGVEKSFSSITSTQFRPSINNISVKLFDENGKEIIEDGIYDGKYFTIEEKYSVISPKGVYDYLTGNAGSNTNLSCGSNEITDLICNISTIYKFTEQGTVTQLQSVEMLIETSADIMNVQSGAIDYYISVPFSTKKVLEYFDGSNAYNLIKTNWEDNNYPPILLYEGASNLTSGNAVGYHPLVGTAKSSTRKDVSKAGFIWTSRKLYPQLTEGLQVSRGEFFESIGIRLVFSGYDTDVPALSWYYVNNDIYLVMNVQKTVNKYVDLPEYLKGLKCTIIKTDGTINLPLEYTCSRGIKVETTNYGFALVKLTKD